LGSFYPFSRNHNAIGSRSQEPYAFGPKMANITRYALLQRYNLLPYIYTAFFRAHADGSTVARPLFFEFPKGDPTIVPSLDRQFLLGKSLMISPVLDQGATTVDAYFPDDNWYNYYDGEAVQNVPGYVTLPAPIEIINLHIRGSSIIPTQQPNTTTTASRLNPFGLLVALGRDGGAVGEIYIDDGESLDTYENGIYNLISYKAASGDNGSQGTLTSTVVSDGYSGTISPLGMIIVFGVSQSTSNTIVTVNGESVESFFYNSQTQVLTVTDLSLPMTEPFVVKWMN